MTTKTVSGAIVDWLEEIPLDELNNEEAISIIERFRFQNLTVNKAIALLEENCLSSLEQWIKQNEKLDQELSAVS
jgi:hypothetical protein